MSMKQAGGALLAHTAVLLDVLAAGDDAHVGGTTLVLFVVGLRPAVPLHVVLVSLPGQQGQASLLVDQGGPLSVVSVRQPSLQSAIVIETAFVHKPLVLQDPFIVSIKPLFILEVACNRNIFSKFVAKFDSVFIG